MLYNNLDLLIKEIKNKYKNAPDITFREISIKKERIAIVFSQSLTSSTSINDFILKNISSILESNISLKPSNCYDYFKNVLPSNVLREFTTFEDLYNYIGNGFTCILFNKKSYGIAIETKGELNRAVSEPLTEQTISGPKDAFNENYMINIGLIRRRIKTQDLIIDEHILGKQTKTRVAVMYMDNIVEKNLVHEINKKIESIDIDGIIDVTYIKESIIAKNNLFPTIITTERPDLASMSLLEGRVIILAENSPFALIVPTFFTDLFHASEDLYQNSKNVTFTRIIRYLAFFLAILTPGFYIAITTYNHQSIPVDLFISFASQRAGVPFPAIVEALGMTLVFEILRESDIRMPHLAGSAISILGAIVLGDAAVSAGIVSSIMVIVIAISAICSLMFSQVAMINAIRFWRILFMIFATGFGIPGLFMAGFLLIINLASLKSFGKPYLYPVTPFNFTFFKDTIGKLNIKKNTKRMELLTDKNYTRSNKL